MNIKYNEKEYNLAFDLNVVANLQDKYGAFETWFDKFAESNVRFIIDVIAEMINEAIDIKNEEEGTKEKKITNNQAGRIATQFLNGQKIVELTDFMIDTIKDDALEEPKN